MECKYSPIDRNVSGCPQNGIEQEGHKRGVQTKDRWQVSEQSEPYALRHMGDPYSDPCYEVPYELPGAIGPEPVDYG